MQETSTILPPRDPDSVADSACLELIHAFDQLVRTIPFYPPEHGLCQESVRHFLLTVAGRVGADRSLRMRYGQTGLTVQGGRIEPDDKAAARLVALFESAGITSLEVSLDATVSDLQQMVARLLGSRRGTESGRLVSIGPQEHLPQTVSMEICEYGRRDHEELLATRQAADLAEVVDEVSTRLSMPEPEGVTDSQRRDRGNALLERLAEEVQAQAWLPDTTVQRNLIEVLDLGATILKNVLPSLTSTAGESALRNALGQALEGIPSAEHPDYIEHVLEILQRSIVTQDGEDARERVAPDDHTLPLPALLELIEGLPQADAALSRLTGTAQPEQLAVYLHLLTTAGDPDVRLGAAIQLGRDLGNELGPEAWEFLVAEILRILQTGDRVLADRVLPRLLRPLTRASNQDARACWSTVAPRLDGAALGTAWPHLVAEIVRNHPERRRPVPLDLMRVAGRLGPAQAMEELGRLESIPAFKAGRVEDALFRQPPVEFLPVAAVLLASSRGAEFAPWLHESLRSAAPSRVAEAYGWCVPISAVQLSTLRCVLTEQPDAWPDDRRADLAARIGMGLLELDQSQRRQPWVPAAIAALGDLGHPRSRDTLAAIISARRLLVFPAWPATCRAVAAQVLSEISAVSEREAP